MKPVLENIFNDIPKKIPNELFKTLLSKNNIKVERIISKGHSSATEEWYDQIQDEWIILLEGQAKLQFENESNLIVLKKGDHLLIPAHRKHRVHWTHPELETIWLAIHIYPG